MSWLARIFLGPKPVPAMDHRDGRCDVRQIQRLLDRGIAASDDRDRFRPVEESVAGGAGRDPPPLVRLLGVEPEVSRGRAGRDDQRIAGVCRGVAEQAQRPAREIGAGDVVMDESRVEPFRVPAHAFHQVRPLHAFGVARPVVDIGGGGHLAADLDSGDQHRREVGPGRIDGGGVAGRTRAQNEKSGVDRFAHRIVDSIRSGSVPHSGWRDARPGPELSPLPAYAGNVRRGCRNDGGSPGTFQPVGSCRDQILDVFSQ